MVNHQSMCNGIDIDILSTFGFHELGLMTINYIIIYNYHLLTMTHIEI